MRADFGNAFGKPNHGDESFDIRAGARGTLAVRNLLVKEGDDVRLTVTGSEAEFVGVAFFVATDSLQVPRFPLGEIPAQDSISGETISFFVDATSNAELKMTVSGSQNRQARASLSADGLFTYTPSPEDRFDFDVAFEAVFEGEFRSQRVNIRTNVIPEDFDLVAQPSELPDAANCGTSQPAAS